MNLVRVNKSGIHIEKGGALYEMILFVSIYRVPLYELQVCSSPCWPTFHTINN